MPFGKLHPDLEKYRTLLDSQSEMSKIYNDKKRKYKLDKNREEKRRYREKLKEMKK